MKTLAQLALLVLGGAAVALGLAIIVGQLVAWVFDVPASFGYAAAWSSILFNVIGHAARAAKEEE